MILKLLTRDTSPFINLSLFLRLQNRRLMRHLFFREIQKGFKNLHLHKFQRHVFRHEKGESADTRRKRKKNACQIYRWTKGFVECRLPAKFQYGTYTFVLENITEKVQVSFEYKSVNPVDYRDGQALIYGTTVKLHWVSIISGKHIFFIRENIEIPLYETTQSRIMFYGQFLSGKSSQFISEFLSLSTKECEKHGNDYCEDNSGASTSENRGNGAS